MCVCGVMGIVMEMDMVARVQILDEAVCIAYSIKTIEIRKNPNISPQTMNT